MAPSTGLRLRQILRLFMLVLAIAAALLVIRRLTMPATPWRDLFPYSELRVGVDPSSPPFAAFSEEGLYGLEIDLTRAFGERIDLPVRFVPLGFDGLYDALKTDQVDMVIAGLSIDLTRMSDVHYSPPYFNAGLMLVSSQITRMAELPGHRLAYEFGSEAESEARRWLRRVLAFETAPYERPTHALEAARISEADAALVDAVSARLFLRDHPGWEPEVNQVTDNLYAVATQSRRPEISDLISEALHDLIEDGTLAELISQWL